MPGLSQGGRKVATKRAAVMLDVEMDWLEKRFTA